MAVFRCITLIILFEVTIGAGANPPETIHPQISRALEMGVIYNCAGVEKVAGELRQNPSNSAWADWVEAASYLTYMLDHNTDKYSDAVEERVDRLRESAPELLSKEINRLRVKVALHPRAEPVTTATVASRTNVALLFAFPRATDYVDFVISAAAKLDQEQHYLLSLCFTLAAKSLSKADTKKYDADVLSYIEKARAHARGILSAGSLRFEHWNHLANLAFFATDEELAAAVINAGKSGSIPTAQFSILPVSPAMVVGQAYAALHDVSPVAAYEYGASVTTSDVLTLHFIALNSAKETTPEKAEAIWKERLAHLSERKSESRFAMLAEVSAKYRLAGLLVDSGELVEGAALYESILQQTPTYATTRGNLGLTRAKQAHLETDMEARRRLIELAYADVEAQTRANWKGEAWAFCANVLEEIGSVSLQH